MRARLALVLLVACAPKPAPTSPQQAGFKQPPPATKPAPVTCSEAAVILRGSVEDVKLAGPEKERVIADACTAGKWSQDVVTCVGSQARPGNCVDGLTDEQRTAYGKQLAAWSDKYPDEYVVFEETGWEPPPPPRVFSCRDGLGDAAAYAPAVTATGDDKELALALRVPAIKAACDAGQWQQDALKCLQDSPPETCRAKLEAPAQKALADKLAESDKLLAKVVAQKKKPAATYDCKKVVAAHYSDAAWKGKLADRKPKDRTKLIADSRAAMTKACTDDTWSVNERACIVAGGGDTCFAAVNQSALRWGFPALTVEGKTGIAECDLLLAHIDQIAHCDKAPQSIRDAYKQAAEQMVAMWTQLPPDQRAQAPAQCKQADDAIRQSATSIGCPY